MEEVENDDHVIERSKFLEEYRHTRPYSAGAKPRSIISKVASAAPVPGHHASPDCELETIQEASPWVLDGWGDDPSVLDESLENANKISKYAQALPIMLHVSAAQSPATYQQTRRINSAGPVLRSATRSPAPGSSSAPGSSLAPGSSPAGLKAAVERKRPASLSSQQRTTPLTHPPPQRILLRRDEKKRHGVGDESGDEYEDGQGASSSMGIPIPQHHTQGCTPDRVVGPRSSSPSGAAAAALSGTTPTILRGLGRPRPSPASVPPANPLAKLAMDEWARPPRPPSLDGSHLHEHDAGAAARDGEAALKLRLAKDQAAADADNAAELARNMQKAKIAHDLEVLTQRRQGLQRGPGGIFVATSEVAPLPPTSFRSPSPTSVKARAGRDRAGLNSTRPADSATPLGKQHPPAADTLTLHGMQQHMSPSALPAHRQLSQRALKFDDNDWGVTGWDAEGSASSGTGSTEGTAPLVSRRSRSLLRETSLKASESATNNGGDSSNIIARRLSHETVPASLINKPDSLEEMMGQIQRSGDSLTHLNSPSGLRPRPPMPHLPVHKPV